MNGRLTSRGEGRAPDRTGAERCSARLLYLGDFGDADRSTFAGALTSAGVELHDRAKDQQAPLVLCFNRRAAELGRSIADESGSVTRVILVAMDHATDLRSVWALLRGGAEDVIEWRGADDTARAIADRLARWRTVDAAVVSDAVRGNLIGRSRAWRQTVRDVVEVALYTEAPILVCGETGTGKELVARLIHTLDPRPDKRDLVLVDCTTLVRELSGSELFGHERGAFTGAVAARDGACALADGGTLFLDEIGELPLILQAELLRVVQEGTYKRVGSNSWRRARFRLICATNRDLVAAVDRGEFRRDLYYRIAGITCSLPSLADRIDDIIPLVEHFTTQLRPELAGREVAIDDMVREYLLQRGYPGNVRELRQLVARILMRHPGNGSISIGNIPPEERPRASDEPGDWRDEGFVRSIRRAVAEGVGLREISRAATEMAIRIATSESTSLRGAARRLGVSERALQLRRALRRGDGQGPSR